jgi:ammonium transporter Rh
MMFIGFGYLMTFLRWYGLGAIGLTMLVTAVGVQVSLLVEPILEGSAVSVGIYALLRANFAVAAFLVRSRREDTDTLPTANCTLQR